MIYLIIYDISSDKIRRKIANRLIAEGYLRIQLSVFVGIKNPKENKYLWSDLILWMNADKYSKLFSISVTKNKFRNMKMIGNLDYDIDYLLGVKHTMII